VAIADSWARVAPYAGQLLDNDDVRDGLRRLSTASTAAYVRARDKRRKVDAVKDRRFQRRLQEAAQAARDVLQAVSAGAQVQRRRRRGPRLLVLLLGGTAATVAASPAARETLSSFLNSYRQPGPAGAPVRTADSGPRGS
jgi:hypothetical protein